MLVSEELIRSEKLLLQMMEKSGWAFILDMGITYITCKMTTGKVKLGDFKISWALINRHILKLQLFFNRYLFLSLN